MQLACLKRGELMIGIQLCVYAIVAVVAAGLPVSAQSWEALRGLQPGEQVKVQETSGQEHSGPLRAFSADVISLVVGKGEVAIEKARVRAVRVRTRGRRVRN